MPLLHKQYSDRAKYTETYLRNFCKENKVTLIGDYGGKITRTTKINGICCKENCEITFERDFRALVEKNAYYCKKCFNEISDKKRQATCIDKYGKPFVSQVKEIKQSIEQTNNEKYGGKTPMHSLEVKEKVKATTRLHFGVDYSSQNKEVKQKAKQTILKNINKEFYDYSKESLELYCTNNQVQLLDNNENCTDTNFYENITRNSKIYYKCNVSECNTTHSAVYRQFIKIGPYCKPHIDEYASNKSKNTYFEKTGYEHVMQNPEIARVVSEKNKIASKNPLLIEKRKQTNLQNNGVEYPMQSLNVQKKSQETCLIKYGVSHPAQNVDIADKASKNAYKKKYYTYPSGKTIECQGYEPFAFADLLKEGLTEEQIINGVKNVPPIPYKDETNKHHVHYPDIYIPNENRLIEVKSTWTAKKKQDNIYLKQQYAVKLGYKYEIWIYDGKGNKTIIKSTT